MKKLKFLCLCVFLIISMILSCGCSAIHSYTYYHLESESFDSEYEIRRPLGGSNFYLPVKDNLVVLYRDTTTNKEVLFTCANDHINLYSVGPLYFPLIPVLGWIGTGSNGYLAATMSVRYHGVELSWDPDKVYIQDDNGNTITITDIYHNEDPYIDMNFYAVEIEFDEVSDESFDIVLGEIVIDSTTTIHPVIHFNLDTIVGWTAVPFWIDIF